MGVWSKIFNSLVRSLIWMRIHKWVVLIIFLTIGVLLAAGRVLHPATVFLGIYLLVLTFMPLEWLLKLSFRAQNGLAALSLAIIVVCTILPFLPLGT